MRTTVGRAAAVLACVAFVALAGPPATAATMATMATAATMATIPTGAPVPTVSAVVDPQAVVVQVPGTSTTPPTACPSLTRSDFVYSFVDAASPGRVVDAWTAPVRLDVPRPPTTATIELRPGIVLPEGSDCRYVFTLASYATEGATWETSGTHTVVDRATGQVSSTAPRLVLVVDPPPCVGQVDLWAGSTRYDGVDGPLPRYPDGIPADASIATWNGDRGCTGEGVTADLVPVAVPSCSPAQVQWQLVNPNGRAVPAVLTLQGTATPWRAEVLAVTGVTPVLVTVEGGVPTGATLVVAWTDSAGNPRTASAAAAAPLQPGTAEYAARCAGAVSVTLDKTAEPVDGSDVLPGTAIVWTITLRNTSATDLPGVRLVDVLPAYAEVTDSTGWDGSGPVLARTVDLPAGSQVVVRYSGRVAAAAPAGVVVVNTALVPVLALSDTTRHPVTAVAPGGDGAGGGGPGAGQGTGSGGGPPGPRGPLAFTGIALLTLLGLAAALIAAGAAVVRATRSPTVAGGRPDA